MLRRIGLTLLAVSATLVALVAVPQAQSPLPLVQPGQLIWDGAFRVPYPNAGNSTVGYAGWALAYSGNNSLYMVGHDYQQSVAEFSVPTGISPSKTTVAQLPVAVQLQPFASMTHGLPLDAIGASASGNYRFGGMLTHNGRLILAEYNSYTTVGPIQKSHWTHSLTTSDATANATGPWRLAPTSLDPAFMDGYMAAVPTPFQALLGGPALTGQCCISIIPRTSFGPSAFAFNPDNLGAVAEPIPTTPLLYYDENHKQPDGAFESDHTSFFNGSTQMAGLFIAEGTRSLLYIGRQGTGDFCYNNGSNSGPANCLNTPADPYCPNDIIHAWPYQIQVWAYDLDDLAAVKAGTKQPWQPRPYAIWALTGNETPVKLPFFGNCMIIHGLAHDPATGRVWMTTWKQDGDRPIVQQFHYSLAAAPPPPPPQVTFTVTPTALTIADQGETKTLAIDVSDNAASWTASSPQSWAVVSPASGAGDGTVTVTVAPNPLTTARSLSLTVAGHAVTVNQAGAPAPPPPPPASGSLAEDWGTYAGGTLDDYLQHVATDAAGNTYMVGGTFGNYPGVTGCGGGQDGIVQKFSPAGQKVWARCLGGPAKDYIHTVAVDSDGVYVAGVTWSTTFPTTAGAYQTTRKGTKDNFVAKYSLAGAVQWVTLLGGSGDEHDRANLTVDAQHTVWVAGSTASTDFPTTAGAYDTTHNGGGNDGYLVHLSATGATLLRGTLIGGSGNDDLIAGIRIGPTGSVIAAGITSSTNLPTIGAVQPAFGGGAIDGFVVRFDATLTTRLTVTYLGGTGDDTICENHGLEVDGNGKVVVMGQTTSPNLPVSATAFQRTLRGSIDVFAAIIAANGQTLEALSYLGGTNTDLASGVGVDGAGKVYVVGYTRSTDFPVHTPLQATLKGAGTLDGTLTVFNATLSALDYSTYLGGDRDDRSRAVAVLSTGRVFVAGDSNSLNYPIKNAAQPTMAGPDDFVLVSFSPVAVVCSYAVTPTTGTVVHDGTGTVAVTVTTNDGSCAWTVVFSAAWLTVTPTSGVGNGIVTLTAAANTGAVRTATVTVAGTAVTLTQDAAPAPTGTGSATRTFEVLATCPAGCTKVEFRINGAVVWTDPDAPFTFTLTNEPASYTADAVITDAIGQTLVVPLPGR